LINVARSEEHDVAQKAASKSAPVVHRLPITQARINLGALVKRIHLNKDYVILEKDGIPIAGVMSIDEFEDYLELRDPKVRAHIRASNAEYLAGKSRPAEEFLKELRGETPGRNKRRTA
jgi:PHD/YefM family antitoxin component YafN of YafNO toxin-antitoxin module